MREIVLGPPGTGKTTELLRMVTDELGRGVPPDRIGYVSFTRRAADEAITRACSNFKLERKSLPYFNTLHALCFRALGMRRNDVLEGKRLKEFADYAGIKLTGVMSEDGTLSGYEMGDRALFIENMARIRLVSLRHQYNVMTDPGVSFDFVERVAKQLNEFKTTQGLVDFTDMLQMFVKMNSDFSLQTLMVDEAQDLSPIQWQVVSLMSRSCERVVIAGDDDQAIYKWAGADPDTLINMKGDARVLGQSWRVPEEVQTLAHEIIRGVRNRRPKEWKPRQNATGETSWLTHFEQADVSGSDVLVLARNSFVLKDVERELKREGFIYERFGFPNVKPKNLQAMVDWEALRKGHAITGDRARVVYDLMKTKEGVAHGHKELPGVADDDPVYIEDLRRDHGLVAPDAAWYSVLSRMPEKERDDLKQVAKRLTAAGKLRLGADVTEAAKPTIRLQTIHTAKGGEADHVVLMTEMARRSYYEGEDNPDDERRVWYVAVTRAREKLTMVSPPARKGVFSCPWL